MDNWRDQLTEKLRVLVDRYEAAGISVRWREGEHLYGQQAMQVEAWRGDEQLAWSDPIRPQHDANTINSCIAQMLGRLRSKV